jgi:hypothetical protein
VDIAAHLQSHFHPPPIPQTTPHLNLPPKAKNPYPNPYLDFWTWSCRTLEWAGPVFSTAQTTQSHHILPILYHHFGCIVPTHDALHLLSQLSTATKPARAVIDLGCGNGYWTYLLREQYGIPVHAVDNAESEWRTRWIADTIVADGVQYLQQSGGAREAILLLVYPPVGKGLTARVIRAYTGDTIVVAGTQNRNGFTGFEGEVIDEWMGREMPGWRKVVQVPLPSFAGKDEALFVFLKGGTGEEL